MKFLPTSLPGAWLIELELRGDERGFLARTYCQKEFGALGLNTVWRQCDLTYTQRRGTIRGLHYQAPPKSEVKLIRCCAGALFDVIVDLRPSSPTYGQWQAFELTAQNRRSLYVPAEFAHGFQCLSDPCEVFYQMSEFYEPDLACGLRWNDPTLNIPWPIPQPILSERDQNLPLFFVP